MAQIAAPELKSALDGRDAAGVQTPGPIEVIDVGASLKYRKSRIPGAYFAIRSRLAECSEPVRQEHPSGICLLGRPGLELCGGRCACCWVSARLHSSPVALKPGNIPASRPSPSSGDTDPKLLTSTDDVWYKPYDKSAGVEQAMLQYLTWEVNLVDQLKREPYLKFALQR